MTTVMTPGRNAEAISFACLSLDFRLTVSPMSTIVAVSSQLWQAQASAGDNYDDGFPSGEVVPVKETPCDFSAAGGKSLGDLYMDDNFPDVKHNSDGAASVEIVDAEAAVALRAISSSPR